MTRRPPGAPAPARHALAAAESFRRIVRSLRASSHRVERSTGRSGAQLLVLRAVADANGASMGEIARRTLTDVSSVSVVVGRLAAAGLVVRARSAADGRRARVTVTRRGAALLRRAPEPVQERLLRALDRLPPDRLAALARGLSTLVAAMGAGEEPAELFFEAGAPRARHGRRRAR